MTVRESLENMKLMRSIIASNRYSPEANQMIEHVLDEMKDEEPDLWSGRYTREEADRIWDKLMQASEELRLAYIAWRAES